MTALAKVIERSHQQKEAWRYTDIEKILAKKVALVRSTTSVIAPVAVSATRLLFINGVLDTTKSVFGDLPREIVQGDAAAGYALTLAGQTCLITQPVELVFEATAAAIQPVVCKLKIDMGASGRLTLIERHIGVGTESVLPETTIVLAAQAKLVHVKIIDQATPHIAATKVRVADGAFYDNFALVNGNLLARNDIDVEMAGPLAQCALNGVMLLDGEHHADTRTCITHVAPHGTSQQYYKIIAGGKAQGVFQGKVVVAKGAQKTDSQQMSRALLLSDQAEVDAKPELEIYADDVKCSHGSTVGDIDAEALFYLRARGVPEGEARALLLRAFAEDVVEKIHVGELRDICRAEIEGWLNVHVR